jgi:hypothetical protein
VAFSHAEPSYQAPDPDRGLSASRHSGRAIGWELGDIGTPALTRNYEHRFGPSWIPVIFLVICAIYGLGWLL